MRRVRLISSVELLLLLSGCDPLHAPLYNLTSCPIEVVTSITNFPHTLGVPVKILPGHSSGVLGGLDPIRYDEIIVRSAQNRERRFDENALAVLRPKDASEDQWAYADRELSFLIREPSQDSLDQIAKQPCRDGRD